MSHPNLSDDINRNIAKSEILGGLWLKDMVIGKVYKVQTKNTLYEIVKRVGNDGGEAVHEEYIRGHAKYCPVWTRCWIHGSTWGGSMIKMGFIGRDMHMEFHVSGIEGVITTTAIKEISE